MLDGLIIILLLTPLGLPMVPLGLPMVPLVPTLRPMVTMVPLATEKRSGFSGYQWYHWLLMVPLVKFPMVPLGESRTHVISFIGNTIGTNGYANGTIGPPNGTNGKPMVPLATNGTIGKISNGTIGRTLNARYFVNYAHKVMTSNTFPVPFFRNKLTQKLIFREIVHYCAPNLVRNI